MRQPPGKEIYRKGNISVYEVDGKDQKVYCLSTFHSIYYCFFPYVNVLYCVLQLNNPDFMSVFNW